MMMSTGNLKIYQNEHFSTYNSSFTLIERNTGAIFVEEESLPMNLTDVFEMSKPQRKNRAN